MGCEVLCSYLTGSNDNQPTWWPLQSLKIGQRFFGCAAPVCPCYREFPIKRGNPVNCGTDLCRVKRKANIIG